MANIIDGKAISAIVREEIAKEVIEYNERTGLRPGLAVVIVGNDPASQVYVRNKKKACEQVGFNSWVYELPESTTQEELNLLIDQLNEDSLVHGILVWQWGASSLMGFIRALILFTRAPPKSPISKHHHTEDEISRHDWGEESTDMSCTLFPSWKPRYAFNHPHFFPGEASVACRESLISIRCLQAGHAFQTCRHPGFSELSLSKFTLLFRAQGLSLAGREQWRS